MANKAFKVGSIFAPHLFADKVAIVTGGATGIGKAITQELLHLGCKVVIASRNQERLEATAKQLETEIPSGTTAQIHPIPCNIRKEEQVSDLMAKTLSTFGRVDYLVNNGGGQFISPMSEISLKGWNAVVETNLTGTFLCCKHAYQHWMAQNGGAIVSIVANMFNGMPGMGHSGAARAGVENITRTMAVEWAEKGVRVNCVAPGIIYSDTAAANYGDSDIFSQMIPSMPARRLGTTEEVASAVCFLLSPGAAYISGATLRIDGGWSLYDGTYPINDHKNMPAYTSFHTGTDKSKL